MPCSINKYLYIGYPSQGQQEADTRTPTSKRKQQFLVNSRVQDRSIMRILRLMVDRMAYDILKHDDNVPWTPDAKYIWVQMRARSQERKRQAIWSKKEELLQSGFTRAQLELLTTARVLHTDPIVPGDYERDPDWSYMADRVDRGVQCYEAALYITRWRPRCPTRRETDVARAAFWNLFCHVAKMDPMVAFETKSKARISATGPE